MRRVRIQNNGEAGYMTQVTDAETGEKLEIGITEVCIKAKDDMPYAILTSIFPVIDIVADAEIKHVCPYCGKSREG
jgi:hypothetical protein